jgi:hypothetical protein
VLSVVAQAFAFIIFIFLCACEDLSHSSDDTDEG